MYEGTTPGGRAFSMACRSGTSDERIVGLVAGHDEYLLRGLSFEGTAIDVGAHIGSVSIPLLLDNPGLNVVACEPVPANLELLRANLRLNEVDGRATVLPVAIGVTDGVTSVFHGYKGPHEHIGNLGEGDPNMETQVLQMTLTALLRDYDTIALLKLDCEGCEWSALDDPAVGKCARIVGEYHDNRRGPARVEEALAATHNVTTSGFCFFARRR